MTHGPGPDVRTLRRVRVEAGALDDGPGWVAVCDDIPEIMGRGDDEDEAAADWMEAFNRLRWH